MLFQILASIQATVPDAAVQTQKLVQGRQTPRPNSRNAYQIETSLYICLFHLSLLGLMTTHTQLFSGNRVVVAQRH